MKRFTSSPADSTKPLAGMDRAPNLSRRMRKRECVIAVVASVVVTSVLWFMTSPTGGASSSQQTQDMQQQMQAMQYKLETTAESLASLQERFDSSTVNAAGAGTSTSRRESISQLELPAPAQPRAASSSPRGKGKSAPTNAAAADPTDPDHNLHVVFPSGCNAFQQWQAELLLHSHLKVGQKGKITRIVHGCDTEDQEVKDSAHLVHPGGDLSKSAVDLVEATVHPHSKLYHTPAVEGSKDFPYFNKPFSLDYFSKHGKGIWEPNDVVVVLDIDEVFITPVTQRPLPKTSLRYSGDQDPASVTNVAKPGKPVGQMYGLGSPEFANLDKLCGKGSPCAEMRGSAWEKYAVGPPLFIHMSDLPGAAELWHKYTKPIFDVRSEQLSEMYAYSAGAANLGLEQVRLEQFMVSGAGVQEGEGWSLLQDWESMSCRQPEIPPGKLAPNFLHYCQTYAAQDKDDNRWLWHKGHVPASILDCDSPILKPPPDDLFNTQKTPRGKRNAWLVCQMHFRVNDMLKDYKEKFCKPSEINLKKQIRLVHAGTSGLPCGNKGCYPLAQTEEEDVLSKVPNDDNDVREYTGP